MAYWSGLLECLIRLNGFGMPLATEGRAPLEAFRSILQKRPTKETYILQKRPIFLRSLLIVATPKSQKKINKILKNGILLNLQEMVVGNEARIPLPSFQRWLCVGSERRWHVVAAVYRHLLAPCIQDARCKTCKMQDA